MRLSAAKCVQGWAWTHPSRWTFDFTTTTLVTEADKRRKGGKKGRDPEIQRERPNGREGGRRW